VHIKLKVGIFFTRRYKECLHVSWDLQSARYRDISEIEGGDLALSERNVLIFAIRSVAFELHQKRVLIELQKETIPYPQGAEKAERLQIVNSILAGATHAAQAGEVHLKSFLLHFTDAHCQTFYTWHSSSKKRLRLRLLALLSRGLALRTNIYLKLTQ
jgi:hypothetical protein